MGPHLPLPDSADNVTICGSVLFSDPPLGIKGLVGFQEEGAQVRLISLIRKLQIRRDEKGRIYYPDVLHALCRVAIPESYKKLENAELQGDFDARLAKKALVRFKLLKHIQVCDEIELQGSLL